MAELEYRDRGRWTPTDEQIAKSGKMPIFRPGVIIAEKCFAVDELGVTWWIDPINAIFHLVTERKDRIRRGPEIFEAAPDAGSNWLQP